MRNSGKILKWANNKNSKMSNSGKDGKESNSAPSSEQTKKKKWIHAPETLVQNHVLYLVKFLGSTEVDQPKGIDVVKQGIQKLKFNQQLRKSEQSSSNKTPKVELTISVDGVTIQEPKTKNLLHTYPLHRISYCADDKAEKRFFSFIAKEGNGDGNGDAAKHTCFVFVSDKLAEEITLTIGQAFELAYKKFLDTSGKEMEAKKQLLVLQKRIAVLEGENAELKKRLRDVANIKGQHDVMAYMQQHDITDDIAEVKQTNKQAKAQSSSSATPPAPAKEEPVKAATPVAAAPSDELICLDANLSSSAAAMDGFTLDDLNDDDFNPRAGASSSEDNDDEDASFDPRASLPPPQTQAPHAILPPPSHNVASSSPAVAPPAAVDNGGLGSDIFARKDDPFGCDPFGMASFEGKGAAAFADSFQNRQTATTAGSPATFSFADLDPLKK